MADPYLTFLTDFGDTAPATCRGVIWSILPNARINDLTHGTRAYAYLGGFDPDFARESPGTILMADAIERAAARGCTTFNFLRGREAYKYEWGAVDRANRALHG